jgi:hypothetical protein
MNPSRCVLVLLVLSGCCAAPWSLSNAPKVAPDVQYREPDATHGNDVYVWTCVDGQHVVISQYSGELTCAAPKLEATACGTLTALELATPEAQRKDVPATRRWP